MTFRFLHSLVCASALSAAGEPEMACFVDGYHGGVYGHYPPGYTGFLVEKLDAHPDWKINLEFEPETWNVARVYGADAYAAFQKIVADQSDAGRVEFVNPTYAQSYLFQSPGKARSSSSTTASAQCASISPRPSSPLTLPKSHASRAACRQS